MDRSVWRLGFLSVLAAGCAAGPCLALTVTPVSPAGYQTAPLIEGAAYFTDAAGTVTVIPPALAGGTLLRTASAAPGVAVSFQVDVRAEVYVCCDPRGPAPTWTSSWVATDMVVGVADPALGGYDVYAKRFNAGTVSLPANNAAQMYFIVVKPSVAIFPRNGWVLLSYDMPYLREIIRQAPLFHVNHIQLSHDIMMFVYQPAEDATLRANLNELIDLAHAYGITDVTVWTHEFGIGPPDKQGQPPSPHKLPANCYAAPGLVNGDIDAPWAYTQSNYDELFSTAVCPELDGVVVTYSEVEGYELWDTAHFKYAAGGAAAVKKSIQTVQTSCYNHSKTFYARTWAGSNQFDVRDGVKTSGDTTTWMMNKNVGGTSGWDWQYMDTHLAVIGTVSGYGYNEMIEFDLCGEYLGRSNYTFNMTAYLKDHWNYAYNLGVRGGIVARIDREGALTTYTANRIHLYAMDRILADRNANPAAINLAWCQQHFPPDAAQDIANAYDDPATSRSDDTRFLTWTAFFPELSPVTPTEAQTIGTNAIGLIDKHRAQLEIQTTLDTRNLKTDYQVLRYGIELGILDVGGTVPTAYGFSNFRPTWADKLDPDCLVDVRLNTPGLDPSSAGCEFSTDGGTTTWFAWPAVCSGSSGTATATITATAVPFNQVSEDRNFIRFHVNDVNHVRYDSGMLRVRTVQPIVWSNFQPQVTFAATPDRQVNVASAGAPLNPATARYEYSTDGGATWAKPQVNWQGRYEADTYPWSDGWAIPPDDGQMGYETIGGGILYINDLSTAGGTKVKYARPWTVNPQVGATVEARMQCLSGGHHYGSNLQLADPLHLEALYLKGNGMIGLYPTWLLTPTDTRGWHTYRVTIHNTDINVYMDGASQPVIAGNGFFLSLPDIRNRLLFGSGSSAGTQQINYDYLYWTTQGAFPPTEWWPASYSGDGQSGVITAAAVPFNQASDTLNRIRFQIFDTTGRTCQSPIYTVWTHGGMVWADFDDDGDVDQTDFGSFQGCLTGSGRGPTPACRRADKDSDGDVDDLDLAEFRKCLAGPGNPPGC